MKRILIALLIAVAAVGCKKDDSVKPEVKKIKQVDHNGDRFVQRTEGQPQNF